MTAPARRRYGLIGTGHRARLYVDAITGPHRDVAELVAWSDTNPGRVEFYARELRRDAHRVPVSYPADAIEQLVAEQSLDRVIVTTPDVTHAEVVSRALLAGADVIVEKPMAIDAAGLRRIADAVTRSGRGLVTTFNYRYSPRNSALRAVIASGRIGAVTSVHFEWLLDTSHGADYFRRWHRSKQQSGGLLVHKASHHFDLVNWWIGAAPSRVYARGALRFYGADNAKARGWGPRPERGTGAAGTSGRDPFSLDLHRDERLRGLYLEAEHHDGYLRDRDPFDPGITIEDNLGLLVDYDSGATMTYALNAHSPWEGYRVSVNGLTGRAELEVVERGAVLLTEDAQVVLDPTAAPDERPGTAGAAVDPYGIRPASERLLVQQHFERAEEVPIVSGHGGHGGGDEALLRALFDPGVDEHAVKNAVNDPLHRQAGLADGVRAVSVGIAGNASLVTGLPVELAELGLADLF